MNDVKLSPPYVEGYNMLKAFFEGDPEITVGELDDDARKCTVETQVYSKYSVLARFLRKTIKDGSFGLDVEVVYTGSDKLNEQDLAVVLGTNPHFKQLIQCFDPPLNSVVFKKEVIQYYNDNFFSPYGHKTILAEDLVKQLFVNKPNCCTDTHD